jgi:hypothetical protein
MYFHALPCLGQGHAFPYHGLPCDVPNLLVCESVGEREKGGQRGEVEIESS